MSKVGGLSVHEVGDYIYIHIQHRLLVFNTFFITTSNFGGGGLSPPYQKVGGGGSSPPCPPRFYIKHNQYGIYTVNHTAIKYLVNVLIK